MFAMCGCGVIARDVKKLGPSSARVCELEGVFVAEA